MLVIIFIQFYITAPTLYLFKAAKKKTFFLLIRCVNHFDVTFIIEFYHAQYFKDITEILPDIMDYYKHT